MSPQAMKKQEAKSDTEEASKEKKPKVRNDIVSLSLPSTILTALLQSTKKKAASEEPESEPEAGSTPILTNAEGEKYLDLGRKRRQVSRCLDYPFLRN
jgi:hypothetical protein